MSSQDFIKKVKKIETKQRERDEAILRFLRSISTFKEQEKTLIKCSSEVIRELIEILFRGEFRIAKESFHPGNVLSIDRVPIGQNVEVVFHLHVDGVSVFYCIC